MKAFLAAVLTVALISVGASFVLTGYQRTADNEFTGPGVRIDPDPRMTGAPKG
jgi:hypothetical protein